MDARHFRVSSSVASLAGAALFWLASFGHAATGLPFTSDFETADFSDWSGGPDPTMSIVDYGAYSGTYAVRSTMPGGTLIDNYKDYFFGDHVAVNGDPADQDLWLRFASQLGSDFEFLDDAYHKLAIINFTDSNGLRRYQLIVTVQRSSGEYFIENLKWNADRSFAYTVHGLSQNQATRYQARLGSWDELKMYVSPNTPGQHDGIIRLWVNGQLAMEYTDLYMREDTDFNPNVLIMSNYTRSSGTQWWDDFYLGESDPGSGGDVAPAAPVIQDVRQP